MAAWSWNGRGGHEIETEVAASFVFKQPSDSAPIDLIRASHHRAEKAEIQHGDQQASRQQGNQASGFG